MISKFFIDVKAQAASRPRITKFGGYHTKNYAEFIRMAAKWLRDNADIIGFEDVSGKNHIRVDLDIILKPPKRITIAYGRGDLDNYVKAYLDAFTKSGLFFVDDMQITEINATKRYQEQGEDYGAYITISEIEND